MQSSKTVESEAPVILRRAEVERRTGLPRSTMYELIARGEFPSPIPLTGKIVGWLDSEITAWQLNRIASRNRKMAAA